MANYTDEQIKKALELCINWEAEYCEKCPFDDECGNDGDTPLRNALDLIKRQEAEIERLQGKVKMYEEERKYHFAMSRKKIAEAIKEFAKDIKSYIDAYVVFEYAAGEQNLLDYIDNLVREMVGESK